MGGAGRSLWHLRAKTRTPDTSGVSLVRGAWGATGGVAVRLCLPGARRRNAALTRSSVRDRYMVAACSFRWSMPPGRSHGRGGPVSANAPVLHVGCTTAEVPHLGGMLAAR